MLMGFLDARGRAYDLTFRTTKLRLLDSEGGLELGPGESFRGERPTTASLRLNQDSRWALVLRPVPGTVLRTSQRIVFLGDTGLSREDQHVTFFNVQIPILESAVRHLFVGEAGREFVAVAAAEVAATAVEGDAFVVTVQAPDITRPVKAAEYRLELRPSREAGILLA